MSNWRDYVLYPDPASRSKSQPTDCWFWLGRLGEKATVSEAGRVYGTQRKCCDPLEIAAVSEQVQQEAVTSPGVSCDLRRSFLSRRISVAAVGC